MAAALPGGAPTVGARISPEEQAVLDRISAAALRGRLSFLASDLLEGRDTPSRGLDIAAEYIAAQFREAGLQPSFQTAQVIRARASARTLEMADGSARVNADPAEMRARAAVPVRLTNAPLYKIDLATPGLDEAAVKRKVVVFDFGAGQWAAVDKLWPALMRSGAAAVVIIGERGRGLVESDLFVPEVEASVPVVSVTDEAIARFCRELKPGASGARVTLAISLVSRTEASAKNVVAVLRGSDPELSRTCIVLSAHYDHLGMKRSGPGDRVFSGANDDGSGTVSVIEIASALAAMPVPPRRSIVFTAFFGEEEGLYGSQYFARHLPCPRAATVAGINLEQLGRPDTDKGRLTDSLAFIGKSFTTLPEEFAPAAEATGVSIAGDPALGDDFFSRSDNFSLAQEGIPAQTVAIPANFPDYHDIGDKWDKIDYPNMARLDRMIALGLIRLADDPQPPAWNAENPKTAEYVSAWRHLHTATAPAGR